MREDAQDPVKLIVRYIDVKKRAWFTVNPTDKLEELKTKHDKIFIQIGSNHRTRDVIVDVPGVDFGEEKEEDYWKTVYFPQRVEDDSDVDYMFRVMVENSVMFSEFVSVWLIFNEFVFMLFNDEFG